MAQQIGTQLAAPDSNDHTLRDLATTLRPVAEAFAPPVAQLGEADYAAVVGRIDLRLAMEPAALVRQIRLFVKVLYWLPLLWTGRTMAGLPLERRLAILGWLQDCPVQKLRVGVWGLRTLVFVGYYTNPEVQQQLGYRARPEGWAALREGASADRSHTEVLP